eukprot:gene36569-43578_t
MPAPITATLNAIDQFSFGQKRRRRAGNRRALRLRLLLVTGSCIILNELIPVLNTLIRTRALSPPMRPSPAIPRSALVLGWLGVIPFAVCAALASTGGVVPPGAALHALVLYGVVILSFMGGAHWGLAMAAADA